MSTDNLRRFYVGKYEGALQDYNQGNLEVALKKCIQLIAEFRCPRIIQVQAWQLRSLCTDDYWDAKSHLTPALSLLHSFHDDENELVKEITSHMKHMLSQRESRWTAQWHARGEQPPTERPNPDDGEVDEEGGVYIAVGPIFGPGSVAIGNTAVGDIAGTDAAVKDATGGDADVELSVVQTPGGDSKKLNLNGSDRK